MTALSDDQRAEIVARLSGFFGRGDEAKRLRGEAAEIIDVDSMARADDLVALYEDRAWVKDMPPLKRFTYRGQPVKEDSFARFSLWLQRQKIGSGGRAYQLYNARRMRDRIIHSVEDAPPPASEYVVRPLWREFFKWGTPESDAVGIEVWKRAVRLADGESPSAKDVRQALKDYNAERRSSLPVKTRAAADTYIEAHDKALREVRFLISVGEVAMAVDAVQEMVKLLEAAGVLEADEAA